MISLRPTTPADLPTLFAQQADPESNALAGTKPRTREVFQATWDKIFAENAVTARVILDADQIVGAINCFQRDGRDYIGYWIDKPHWRRGIGTRALALFLQELKARPLHASAATWNTASIRILEQNGFRKAGTRNEPETDRYTAGEVADFILE